MNSKIEKFGYCLFIGAVLCFTARAGHAEARSAGPLADILSRSYQRSTVKSIVGHSSRVKKTRKQSRHLELPAFVNAGRMKQVERYQDLIDRYSGEYGLDADLVKAVIYMESGGNPQVVSPKGAGGLMQLMPGTAAELGVKDLFDPEENIKSGTRYLSSLLRRFKSTELALWAYNAGPRAVVREHMPLETQNYVPGVMRLKRQFEQQSGD
ncbi:MAG: transglycosylase [Gemmatimonadetes bacterium]|nr:transglycosylase [Gemmatimonadota bacterium]|tara:strand:- start:374 stop:1003 length:630 start_codon:yes stop_codon:yes gene_type:complete